MRSINHVSHLRQGGLSQNDYGEPISERKMSMTKDSENELDATALRSSSIRGSRINSNSTGSICVDFIFVFHFHVAFDFLIHFGH